MIRADVWGRACAVVFALTLASIVIAPFGIEGARAEAVGGVAATPAPPKLLLTGSLSSFVIDPHRDRLYLSQPALSRIVVWNTRVDAFVTNITTSSVPASLDLSADGTELYVALPRVNSVAIVDLASGSQTASIRLSATPVDVVAGRPGRAYATTTEYWGYPRIIDTDLGREIGNITAADVIYQGALARVTADRSVLYVGERGLSPASLTAFSILSDDVTLIGKAPFGILGSDINDLDLSTDGTQAFVASSSSAGAGYYVLGLYTGSWIASAQLPTGPWPNSVTLDQRAAIAFAAHSAPDVIAFDTANGTQIGAFTFSQDVGKVRTVPDGTKIYTITYGAEGRFETALTGLGPTSPEPPLLRAFANPTYGYAPLAVTFRASALLGAPPFNVSWQFGDGGTAYDLSPIHAYNAAGSFLASVRIRDAAGYEATQSLRVWTVQAPLPGAVQTARQLTGIGFGPENLYVPPDPQIAAGPDHVIEMVNVRVRITTKEGAFIRDETGQQFFQVPNEELISDPRIVFDTLSNRWFATMFSVTQGSVLLAVSSTADPTLPWRVYTYPSTGCPDQPYFGVSESLVIISANTFVNCQDPTYVGAEYWVIAKAGLVANTTDDFVHLPPDPDRFAVRPVHSMVPGTTAYMVTVGDGESTSTNLTFFQVHGVPPGPVVIEEAPLTLRPFRSPPIAPQPMVTVGLDTIDSRIHDAFWDGTSLWFAFGTACQVVSDILHACLRIVELDPVGITVRQDFDIFDLDHHFFLPALRTDSSGNLIVAFGYSSGADYPGLMVASHLRDDPPNTFRQPMVVRRGSRAEALACSAERCRYGDYFGAARDPVNPSLIWIVGEVGGEVGGYSAWQTVMAGVGVFPTVHFTVSYAISGGGSGFTPPTFTSHGSGIRTTRALDTNPEIRQLDRGSPWEVPAVLEGSSATERWITTSTTSGIATEDAVLPFVYVHQYWVNVSSGSVAGGNVSPKSGWLDAEAPMDLVATASTGWKFAGWEGDGPGAYSGTDNPARVPLSGSVREVALFWPGLTVSVNGGGSLAFTYRNVSGIIPAGTTRTLFVPPGTTVLLVATPSALSRFSAWSGAAVGPLSAAFVVVDEPLQVAASFSEDLTQLYLPLGGASIAAAVLIAFAVRRRRRA